MILAIAGYVTWTYAVREWRHWRLRSAIEASRGAEPGRLEGDREARDGRPSAPIAGAASGDGPERAPAAPAGLGTDDHAAEGRESARAAGAPAPGDTSAARSPAHAPAESLNHDDRQALEKILKQSNPARAGEKKN